MPDFTTLRGILMEKLKMTHKTLLFLYITAKAKKKDCHPKLDVIHQVPRLYLFVIF